MAFRSRILGKSGRSMGGWGAGGGVTHAHAPVGFLGGKQTMGI